MDDDKKPSRRHRPAKVGQAIPWWLQQARERPLATAGTIVTVVGSLILLWFFLLLGEVPELDLPGISAIAMAVAVVGFALATALASSGFAAGVALRGPKDELDGLGLRQSAVMFLAPGALCAAAFSSWLAVFPDTRLASWLVAVPYALSLAFSCAFALFIVPKRQASAAATAKSWKAKAQRTLAYSFHGLLWATTTCVAFLMFFLIFPRDGERAHFLLGLVAWVLFCLAQNFVVAWAKKANVLKLLPACVGTGALALLASTGNWAGFPKAVMGGLGLGETPVALVVTAEGCDLLNKAQGGPAVCQVEPGEKTAVVCPAMLRSRIGSPVFIGLSAYQEDGRWPQLRPPKRLSAIAIPKAEIRSWTRLTPTAASAPMTAASGVVVTHLNGADQGKWLREQCGAGLGANPASTPPAVPPASATASNPSANTGP